MRGAAKHIQCLACGLDERNADDARLEELYGPYECGTHGLHYQLQWHDVRLCGDVDNGGCALPTSPAGGGR